MTFDKYISNQSSSEFKLQLKEEFQLAQLLLNHVTGAAFLLGSDTGLLCVNDLACSLLEYSREELLSLNMHDVAPDFSAEDWSEQWQSLQHNSLTFKSRYRTKSGRIFPVEVTITYMKYRVKEFICISAYDKTVEEVEVRQALKQEIQLRQLRERVICMLSHELRVPLNIISFSSSLLRRYNSKWTEEKKLPYLDRIQTAVEQISQLLDVIMLVGKAEAGKLKFEPKPLNLHIFCCELLAQMQSSINSSRHTITLISKGSCATTYMDEKLLQPILVNLLSNAMKYSPIGSTIDLELFCQDGNVVFQIKDAGIGITLADQELLFEPFHRGNNVGNIPGTGLGLTIVKKLVELHGGRITVSSVVGVGTTFTVTLPDSNKSSYEYE